MGNQQVTREQIAWLAGIWDGEGTFSVRCSRVNKGKYSQYSPNISVVNSNAAIINEVVKILSDLNIPYHAVEKGRGGFEGSSRQCYVIAFCTLSAANKFLPIIIPFLVGKRPQAELMKRFVDSRIARRNKVSRNSECEYNKEELNALAKIYDLNGNQRGSSETTRQAAALAAR